MKVPWARYY